MYRQTGFLKALTVLICTLLVPITNGMAVDRDSDPVEFRILVEDHHQPFSYVLADGEVRGLSVEIIRLLLEQLKRDVKLEPVPWQRALAEHRNQRNIILASVVRLPQREQQFLWLGRLFREPTLIYALRERGLKLTTVKALADLRIGTIRSGAAHMTLLAHGIPAAQLESVTDPLQNLRKLVAKRIDLISAQPSAIALGVRQLSLDSNQFVAVFPLLPPVDSYLTASLGSDPALVKALTDSFAVLERSGRLAELRAKAGVEQ